MVIDRKSGKSSRPSTTRCVCVCVCVNMCIHVNVCMYMYTHTVSVYATKGFQIFDNFTSPSPGSDTGAQVRDFRQFQRVHCCLDGAQGTSMF